MSIENLRKAVERRESEHIEARDKAAISRIAETSAEELEKLKSLFPSLFEGSDPINAWVQVESTGGCGSPNGRLGAILENGVVLCIYRGSDCTRMAIFRYLRGMTENFAACGLNNYFSSPIVKDHASNEKTLLRLISRLDEEMA